MAADHVVVLDGARVADAGTPRDLAGSSEAFARLFEIDLSAEALGAKADRRAGVEA